jgi:predicted SnoaL-like aldol condensation-catalyzing enzyme
MQLLSILRLSKGMQRMSKVLFQSGVRSLAGGVFCLALAVGYSTAAGAVEYTAKEKANIELVRGLYDGLETSSAAGTLSKDVVGIANKYIAENYIQHSANSSGKNGRAAFIAEGQRAPGGPPPGGGAPGGAGGLPGGAGGPPGGAPGAAGGPPGGAGGPPGGAPGAGGPGGPGRGPAKVLAFMASGDYVVRISNLGNGLIWNMFRVENGFLAEHWDGMGSGTATVGLPGGVPAAAK